MSPVAAFDKEFPAYTFLDLEKVPDNHEDHPYVSRIEGELGQLRIPSLVFGAATLSHHYNDINSFLKSDVPFRVVRLALRYGITAFDTSPYYGSSEEVLGQILKVLEPEFPRSSYKLMTKCGRYGLNKSDFDYSPETIQKSVARSLKRLNTDYLDVVYLHDVEFVASPIYPTERSGRPDIALAEGSDTWGLAPDDRVKVRGDGDQIILKALAELFKLKAEGKLKAVGITGYSLPVLLRLATLSANQASLEPLDAVLSFCHLTIQNSSLRNFLPLFKEWGRVSQIISASPLSMGLLTSNPPSWHPAPEAMRKIGNQAEEMCKAENFSLADVALHYGLHSSNRYPQIFSIPIVLGLSKLDEVHEVMRILNLGDEEKSKLLLLEEKVKRVYTEAGYNGWSWASPS